MSTASDTSPAASGEYSHRQILTILTGLLLGMFLAALDQTIVSTAIRTISDDLHGLSVQAWVTTAYLVTSTITTPIYGKLGDLWGRKKLFMFAIIVFIAGSALCSFATSMYELAAFRAFQGLGAGGLMTLVLAIIGDIVSPRERARYTGYFMATFGTASVVGPVVGGLLAGTSSILGIAGWRWVFLVNVPIGFLALVVIFRTLHVQHTKREARVDWMGATALVVCLVPLLVVAEQGQDWGWGSTRSLLCIAVGLVGLALFIWVEARMKLEALIPLKLFTIKAASVTIVASVIVGMGMFGAMMLLPLYMQIVHGASPTQSGFLMLPLVAGLMCASLISGRIISRTGRTRPFPIAGSLIMAAGLFLLSRIGADTVLWKVDLMMALVGFGIGNCMQPLILTMQSSVPPTAIGVATSSATFFRQIGGTVGVALFLSLLFGSVGTNIKHSIESASKQPAFTSAMGTALKSSQPPASIAGHQMAVALQDAAHGKSNSFLSGVVNDSAVIQEIKPTILAHPLKAGFADSMTPAFALAGGLGLLAFLVLLLMPEVKLRETSASEARAAAAEAIG